MGRMSDEEREIEVSDETIDSLVTVNTPLGLFLVQPSDIVERGEEKNVVVTIRSTPTGFPCRLYSEVYDWRTVTFNEGIDVTVLYIEEAMINTID
jgi:hypothetical protein